MGEDRIDPTCLTPADRASGRALSLLVLALLALAVIALVIPLVYGAGTPGEEPIASIGHGGFFGQDGRQIVPTAAFVAKAQAWYRERLLAQLDPSQRDELADFERQLGEGLQPQGQEALVMQQRALDWLLAQLPRTPEMARLRGKVGALGYRLKWRLPSRDDLEELRTLEPFPLDPKLEARLQEAEFNPSAKAALLDATTNSGQAYIDECTAAGVPIPPTINLLDPSGTAGWRKVGFIPQGEQFITGTPAEVRVFESSAGMCIALPRFNDKTLSDVNLDGVICLSKTTSKVCFWDNQMGGTTFSFPAGTKVPIGVPNLAVNPAGQYQAGGAEIENNSTAGICTDCHAGENPYIIHPNADLGGVLMGELGTSLGLPTFGPNRYAPIVAGSWPQNQLSHSQALVPDVCGSCHTLGGEGGRFPHLSKELDGYCNTILAQAIDKTMPPFDPGGEAGNPLVTAFKDTYCSSPASAGPSNRGDPHLITTNGVHYDFQAGGEFVALRNSATGFELQTRQTPVLTSFTPGANAYTGLASCVSLNTAAALRVGGRRISYQPTVGRDGRTEVMQLRVDGKPVSLPADGLSLGGGNRIAKAAEGGGIDVLAADGTRVIVSPNFWSSEGYWYLNVEVLDTPAREGTMGTVVGTDFLPLAPNGASFGPRPASLASRHMLLNQSFADAWRVTAATSLFDYPPGTSTATFTARGWPPPPGGSCQAIRSTPWPGGKLRQPVQGLNPEEAKRICGPVEDEAAREACIFDVTATGNTALVDAYRITLKVRKSPFPQPEPPGSGGAHKGKGAGWWKRWWSRPSAPSWRRYGERESPGRSQG
jgi:hypothetical protein